MRTSDPRETRPIMTLLDRQANRLKTIEAYVGHSLHLLGSVRHEADHRLSLSSRVRLLVVRSILRMTSRILDGWHYSEYTRVAGDSLVPISESESWTPAEIETLEKSSPWPIVIYKS